MLDYERTIPSWVDGAIRKAVHPNPYKRYETTSEFIHDLRHPNRSFVNQDRPPLMERNPLLFWKGVSFILLLIVILLLTTHPALSDPGSGPIPVSNDQGVNHKQN